MREREEKRKNASVFLVTLSHLSHFERSSIGKFNSILLVMATVEVIPRYSSFFSIFRWEIRNKITIVTWPVVWSQACRRFLQINALSPSSASDQRGTEMEWEKKMFTIRLERNHSSDFVLHFYYYFFCPKDFVPTITITLVQENNRPNNHLRERERERFPLISKLITHNFELD